MKRFGVFLCSIVVLFGLELDDYVIIKRGVKEVRLEANEDSPLLMSVEEGERYNIIDTLDGWYEINLEGDLYGYIESKDVTLRMLQKEKALEEIEAINNFVSKKLKEGKEIVTLNKYTYNPLLSHERIRSDFEGRRLLYGVKAFFEKRHDARWVYVGDRQIVAIEDWDDGSYVRVTMPQREEELYIEKDEFNYSKFPKVEDTIKKFIVVDRRNQNVALYEDDEELVLINSALSSTGYDNSKNSFRTPLGTFVVANLKDFMVYTGKDEDNQLYNKGKAPYAVRFSGGNYLHGIPIEDDLPAERISVLKTWRKSLLGSYPLSHGCVRNDDSMAKEIFEWIGHKRDENDYIYPTEVVSVVVIE